MSMDNILVPVSPGELLDKITILEIKSERISDPEKVANVRVELELLRGTWSEAVEQDDVIRTLHSELRDINETLWKIEDRSGIKKKLNLHLGSRIIEEKSYKDY